MSTWIDALLDVGEERARFSERLERSHRALVSLRVWLWEWPNAILTNEPGLQYSYVRNFAHASRVILDMCFSVQLAPLLLLSLTNDRRPRGFLRYPPPQSIIRRTIPLEVFWYKFYVEKEGTIAHLCA